jgi:hypothetical protein
MSLRQLLRARSSLLIPQERRTLPCLLGPDADSVPPQTMRSAPSRRDA